MGSRQPHNLQGLLRFALDATKSEDSPNPSAWQEMDPERRHFLEHVLKSMTVDVIVELEKAIKTLENDESSVEDCVNAIEVIQDFIDQIDSANNFIKIGGSKIILTCLSSEHDKVRAGACAIIAELSQNNPFCQDHFLDQDIFPKLVELLNTEDVAPDALHAISCLSRNHERGLADFIKIGGLECILGCLESRKVCVKSCFMISTFSSEFPSVRDEFIKLGACEKLAEHIQIPEEYDTKLEVVLSALNQLTAIDSGVDRCMCLGSKLETKLEEIKRVTKGRPEFEEIIQYADILIERCFQNNGKDTDRSKMSIHFAVNSI